MPDTTLLFIDPKENPAKCTVEPLRAMAEFEFRPLLEIGTTNLANWMCLVPDAPPLTPADRDQPILFIDTTWQRLSKLPAPKGCTRRSLLGWQTAYPRGNNGTRPSSNHLATVEAIFAAHTILGRPTDHLLDSYHWRDRFLELNQRFLKTET